MTIAGRPRVLDNSCIHHKERIMANTNLQITFTDIEVHRDGDPIDRGELYWSLRVDGVSVSSRSAVTPLTIDSPGAISLGSSRTVAKSAGASLLVSGSVSEQDSGPNNDETGSFSHTYVAGNNWGVGSHTAHLLDSNLDVTVKYTIKRV
jgi:hypothetical protein